MKAPTNLMVSGIAASLGLANGRAFLFQVIAASHHPLFLQAGRAVEFGTGYAAHLREGMCRALGCEAPASAADDPLRTEDDP